MNFKQKCDLEHELQLQCMKWYIRIHTVVMSQGTGRVNYHNRLKQKLKLIFFYQKYVNMVDNTCIPSSQITEDHVHVIIFV